MTIGRDLLTKAETVTAAAIEAGVPTLVEALEIIAEFHLMIRRKTEADLIPWIERARASLVAPFASGGSRRMRHPDPDIIMRRVCELGKDHDPSDGSNATVSRFTETDRPTSGLAIPLPPALAPFSQPGHLRRVERYRFAEWLQQDELDIKPQLKGRLTHCQFFDPAQLEEARSVASHRK
jgi:hypothetical protein